MSRIAIKICGLSTPEIVDAAIHAGASHVGMVFFRKSPRHVDFDKAAALAARMPDHVRRVGVFVDPDEELLEHAISRGHLPALQLHGQERSEARRRGQGWESKCRSRRWACSKKK